ncbi:hypothetical protein PGB90_007725 [Kerria lacca]
MIYRVRAYPKYKYNYDVQNVDGGQHGHQVSQDGIHTSGKYYVKLKDGVNQHVEYYTDALGYHPKVTYSNSLDSGRSGARVSFGTEIKATNLTKLYQTDATSPVTVIHNTNEQTFRYSTESSRSPTEVVKSDIANKNNYFTRINDINPDFGLRFVDNRDLLNSADVRNNSLMLNFDFANVSSNENREIDYNVPSADSVNSILLVNRANMAADSYLHPEINEITNGFLGKIVSVVPDVFTTGTKLLKPIIVSENVGSETSSFENASVNLDLKSDQSFESAQMQEYRETSPYEELLPIPQEQIATSRNENISSSIEKEQNLNNEIFKKKYESEASKTEVNIEPQTIEEQAVITTTVDIAKSLPLTMNFISEVDNHLNEHGQPINSAPSINMSPSNTVQPLQRVHVLPQSNLFLAPKPTLAIPYNDPRLLEITFPQNFPSRPTIVPHHVSGSNIPTYQYVPIPIFLHQPNVIPLNFANDVNRNANYRSNAFSAETTSDTLDKSHQLQSMEFKSQEVKNTIEENISKRENNAAKLSAGNILTNVKSSEFEEQKLIKQQPISNEPIVTEGRRPFSIPYAFNVPATHLIPYVKQVTNSPGVLQTYPFSQHLLKQQPNTINAVPRAHSTAYSIKLFPKDIRKPQQKFAPFKPSHPVWDSIYPPQHMYYVPYYVADKVPGERKARESSSKRNHRHLRRLYVEYGGFKPPMIPSTLLENEETNDKEDNFKDLTGSS